MLRTPSSTAEDLHAVYRPPPGGPVAGRSRSVGIQAPPCSAGCIVQRGVQQLLHPLERALQLALVPPLLLAPLLDLMGEIERGEHRDPVKRRHAVVAADLAHA